MDKASTNHARLQRSHSFSGFSPSAMQTNELTLDLALSGDGDDGEEHCAPPPSIASIHPAFVQRIRSSTSSRASESTTLQQCILFFDTNSVLVVKRYLNDRDPLAITRCEMKLSILAHISFMPTTAQILRSQRNRQPGQ